MNQGKSKLLFRNLEISDKEIVDRTVRYAESMSCQLSFANLYCLSGKYNTKICISDGILYIRQSRRDENLYAAYLLPMKIPEEYSESEDNDPSDWLYQAGKQRLGRIYLYECENDFFKRQASGVKKKNV